MYPIKTQDKLFHDGDGISELGTILPAWYLNQIQAELIAILQDAGIEPAEAKQDQVLTAIKNIVSKNVPAATGDKAGILKVINNLTSDDNLNALSAAQGKVLDRKISSMKIPAASSSEPGILKVLNALTSTDALSALSAAQGKVINDRINTMGFDVDISSQKRLVGVDLNTVKTPGLYWCVDCVNAWRNPHAMLVYRESENFIYQRAYDVSGWCGIRKGDNGNWGVWCDTTSNGNVRDVRLGPEVYQATGNQGDWWAAWGHVLRGYHIGVSNGARAVDAMYSRPIQKYVDGVWYNCDMV